MEQYDERLKREQMLEKDRQRQRMSNFESDMRRRLNEHAKFLERDDRSRKSTSNLMTERFLD